MVGLPGRDSRAVIAALPGTIGVVLSETKTRS